MACHQRPTPSCPHATRFVKRLVGGGPYASMVHGVDVLLCQGQGSSPSALRCHYNMALRPPACMPPFSASRVVSGSGGRVADHDIDMELEA